MPSCTTSIYSTLVAVGSLPPQQVYCTIYSFWKKTHLGTDSFLEFWQMNKSVNQTSFLMTKKLTFKALLLSLFFAAGIQMSHAQTTVFLDDFETYSLGNISPQSDHWIPWNLMETSPVGAEVSNTFASNGTKSMKVKLDGAGDDQLLQLGNKSTGRYDLKWKMYIPVGNAGYFNVQTDQNTPGATNANFSLQVYFRATGLFDSDLPAPLVSGSYPQGTWFEVAIRVDLDNNLARLLINGNLVRIFPYTLGFGAIDFFSADATYTFYVDEVSFVALPPPNVDICAGAIDLTAFFGAAPGVPQTTGIYDNTTATASTDDPPVTCWLEDVNGTDDVVNRSMWYNFVGDGKEYHIETVPCNATNYIGTQQSNEGDTQMLIYTGDDCSDLTEVACNDNKNPSGIPDWRSGLDIQTESGQSYFMLIDGFDFLGEVATGQFCIEIKKAVAVSCAQAAAGTYEVPNPFLCFEAQLADLVQLDNASFSVPDEGNVAGMAWAFTTAPLEADAWPADAATYVGRSPVLDAAYVPAYVNTGPPGFQFGVYYITPVVLGGGVLINPAGAKVFENIDPSNGCFETGASTQVFFLPLLDDVTATIMNGPSTATLTVIPSGGLGDLLGDDSFYTYHWSNGATTKVLSNVASGSYTCTVSDVSGCALEAIVTGNITVGTKDPASVQSFTVSPNPTSGKLIVNLDLASASDVRVEVLNTLGQTLQAQDLGKVSSLTLPVELGNVAQGTYFLRVTLDGETAIRRVVLQR